MPGFSFGEILVLALVAIIFLKPEDIPHVMRQAGLWVVTIRRYLHGMLSGLDE